MATTDQELKQLNKSVSEALNILKAFGNIAQMKAKTEDEKELLKKWFEVTDDQKEQIKHQRAFTERARDAQGRFIKKREGLVGKFYDMAKAIKGSIAGKMVLGVTTAIGSFTKGLMSNFSNFFQAVKNQFLGLFGEESEWFELLGSIKDSIVNVTSSIFNFIFRRTPAWARKQIKVLKDMYKLQVKQMKLDFMDAGGKKKGKISWEGLLAAFLFTLGASIGAFLHRYFILITKLPIFGKISKWFRKLDDIPFIGKLFKAVKFGFKWLGWPLTLLLSMIDFIKGFKETSGSLFEKVKEGLWSALEGFIELPIKLIGWLTEKALDLFGVEVEGLSKKFMDITKTGFMMIFDVWKPLFDPKTWAEVFDFGKDIISAIFDPKTWAEVFDFGKDIISAIAIKAREWKNAIVDSITNIVFGVVNFFTGFWNNMVDFMASKIPSWIPGSSSLIKGLKSMQLDMTTPGAGVAAAAIETDKMRIANRTAQQNQTAAGLKELNENVRLGTAENRNAISSMANIQKGGDSTTIVDQQQIADEIDNNLLSIANYGGA